jgi:hypothetical protein
MCWWKGEGDGERQSLRLVGPQPRPSPCGGEGRRREEEWATLGPEERGRGNGPKVSRSISSLFLFPEFHPKLLERNSNPKIISKESYHHKFNKQKQTVFTLIT